jgi:hypothetical protein
MNSRLAALSRLDGIAFEDFAFLACRKPPVNYLLAQTFFTFYQDVNLGVLSPSM